MIRTCVRSAVHPGRDDPLRRCCRKPRADQSAITPRDHERLGAAVRAGYEQFERAATVGLGAVAMAEGLGHGAVAAVLGRCP